MRGAASPRLERRQSLEAQQTVQTLMRSRHLYVLVALTCALIASFPAAASAGQRLDRIRQKGSLTCGVSPGVAGWAEVDRNGRYGGFDVDICRAVAAAILGNPDRVTFVQAASVQEFVTSSDPDIVARRLTVAVTREASGVIFGPIFFYDGQGFLAARSAGVKSANALAGMPICVDAGTHYEFALVQHFRASGLAIKPVALKSRDELGPALQSGRCRAYTADVSELGSIRSRMPNGGAFDILPDLISKEPLAPLVRQDDVAFYNIVRWTVFALIAAEELGITSANIDQMMSTTDPDRKRLLGVIPGNGKALGLDERWAYNVVKTLGNYGEMFDRNVGARSPIKLERGLNRLWTAGGLIYAPLLR
jgi:general L-amino acid transport system substrate-binding protein